MITTTSSQEVGTENKAEGTENRLEWTLKAGVHYCFHGKDKLFELKQGLGKWTITAFGQDFVHAVPLEPDQARLFALRWFKAKLIGLIDGIT